MTELFVNFPQIYCSQHPAYLLSMICRHPNCKNKGAICCRCQLKSHNGDGHNLESFVPLDEVLQLCETQNPKAEYFEDLSINGILEIQQIQTLLPRVNNSIHKQLERELLLLGQFQKPFKDIFGLLKHYTQIDGNTTRTDDGIQGGMKSDFLNLMKYIAEKIILINGEYILDQSDMNECLTEIIERKKKNLELLTKLNKHTQKQIKIIEALFNTGCSYGIDYRIPLNQFNDWIQVYSVQYYELINYMDIKTLPIPKNSLVMIGNVKDNIIEICAIDKYKAIFYNKINQDSKLQWKFNDEYLGCQCIRWEFNKLPLQQNDQNLYHINDRRVIFYLQL